MRLPQGCATLLLTCLLACSKAPSPPASACATYETDARPILDARCAGCHGAASPAAGYRLDSYAGAVARRGDATQRAVAGDRGCALLSAARGESPGHQAAGLASEELEKLESWVVDCRLAPARYGYHAPGLLNPGDREQFHGLELRARGYEVEPCRACHGERLAGGRAAGCDRCHPGGPFACGTCHGGADSPAPPRDLSGARASSARGVGAHRLHLQDGPLHHAYSCEACHPLVDRGAADAHYRLRGSGEADPAPAEVWIRPTVGFEENGYDSRTLSCGGAWCHAPSPSAERRASPIWTGSASSDGACDRCHGLPPAAPHPQEARCESCHASAFARGRPVPRLHANGTVDLGDGSGGCSACHGDAGSPAPPRDLEGGAEEWSRAVGAHRAHLDATNGLRGPIPCSECHAVPASVDAPGHLGARPAELFPRVEGVGVLARRDRLEPTYDPATSRCASVYCHGNGYRLAVEQWPDFVRSPTWTGGSAQVACGSCHGVPPREPKHEGMTDQRCSRCHGQSVDDQNRIKITVDPQTGERRSTHIDGVVNMGTG